MDMQTDDVFSCLQSTVGTIVKSGDHGDPVGVLTVLNTNRYKSLKFMLDIKAYLLKHCKLPSTKQDLETVSLLDVIL